MGYMNGERDRFSGQPNRMEHPSSLIRRTETEAPEGHEVSLLHPITHSDEYALADIRRQLEVQIPQVQGTSINPEPDTIPHTFKEMFEPNEKDNPLQRLSKWYFKPRGNPETTIKVLEALQIHQFQKLPKFLARFFTRDGHRYQSTYTVKDSRLSSLIDYAANQSAFNEAMHIGAIAATNVPFGIMAIETGNTTSMAIQGGITLFNVACILAQRYSRARCERLIDKSLERGKTIDYYEYNNRLNLRLPQGK